MTQAGAKKEKKKKTGTIKPSKSKGYYIDGIYVDPYGPGRGVPTSGRLPDARFKRTAPLIEEARELSQMAGIDLAAEIPGSKREKEAQEKFIKFVEKSASLSAGDKRHYTTLIRSGRADLSKLRNEVRVKIKEGHERKRVADKKLVADLTTPFAPGRVPVTDIRTARRMKEISERARKGAEVDRRMERLEAETGVVTPSGMVIPSKPTVVAPGLVRPKPISTEEIISGMGKQPITRGRTPLDKRIYDASPWKERPGQPVPFGGSLMTAWYGEWVERAGNIADKRHWGLGWVRKDAVSKFADRFKTHAKQRGLADPSLRRPSITALEGREVMTALERRRIEAERGMVTGKRGRKYDADLARKLSEAKIKRGEVVVERGKTWIVDPVSGKRVLAPEGIRVTAPAAKEVARLERKSVFKPMTEEQKEALQLRRDLTFREIERQAALYTDRMKAARFMATAMRGRTKKFPTHGYSIHKIEQAYRKKMPRGMWKIKIRRDRPRELIYIKIIAPNTYVNKKTGETITTFPYSSSIEDEFVKILTLHGMVLYPGEKVVSHRRPKVGKGFINLHLRAKVYKPSEQRVRP